MQSGMSLPLDRPTLEGMKRADLQRLCKDHGIKANLKSEALVDLLLDTMQPRTRPAPDTQPKRTSSLRIVSRSTAGSRSRGLSGSSLIIHDTDDEDDDEGEGEEQQDNPTVPEADSIPDAAPAAPRTRKAKQTQYRLGVGRPTLVGGTGARAQTKSLSVSRGKRGKSSRSVKPSEDVIQEEDEEAVETVPVAGPSGTSHDPVPSGKDSASEGQNSNVPQPTIEFQQHTEQLIQPLKEQIESLRAEVQILAAQTSDINTLKTQLASLMLEVETLRTKTSRMTEVEAEVQRLRDDFAAPAASPQPSAKSAGKARAIDTSSSRLGTASNVVEAAAHFTVQAGSTEHQHNHPGLAQSLLGKRHRDPDDSHMTGVIEAGKEDEYSEKELAQGVIRPTKKRAKVAPNETRKSQSPPLQGAPDREAVTESHEGEQRQAAPVTPPNVPAFTIFSGPEEPPETYIEPPPPTTRLSELLELPSAGFAVPTVAGPGRMTRTANANENNPQVAPFNFSFSNPVFQPVTSTPAGPFGLGMPSFSYPEPPTSPTPGANVEPSGGYIERAGGRRERNDLFHPHGAPRRPRSAASVSSSRAASQASHPQSESTSTAGEGTINPAALLHTPPLATVPELEADPTPDTPVVSSTEVGQVLGMAAMPLPPETPAPPMKRTMYGTELEGDTRFGDFGVEGVATGFWTGKAPRF